MATLIATTIALVVRRLADAQHQDDRDDGDDEHSRQVEHCASREEAFLDRVVHRRGSERRRDEIDVELFQQLDEVARPADRDSRRREQVFEHQVPADEPGDAFAQCRVRIRVSAAGHGDHRSELCVAQSGEDAADAGDDERQDDGGTCVLGSSRDP
jgi:hypothetical protein